MFFPVECFACWHILGPVPPIENKDCDGWLVVGKRCEKVALQISYVIGRGSALTLNLTRAWRRQVKGLDASARSRIIGCYVTLLCDDFSDAIVNDISQDRMSRFFRSD